MATPSTTAIAKADSLPPVPQGVRDKIICMLISGEYPTDADIARATGVSATYITKLLQSDPELAEKRREAEREVAQLIEKSAIELAQRGRNEMAKQRSQEFLLKKMYADKYGDNAEKVNSEKGSRKVVIQLKLPEVKIDSDGIPIAQSANPLQEAIDVQ